MQAGRYRNIAGLFSLYFFFTSLVVAMLFVTGNIQSFLETTNRMLMDILEWVLYFFLITDFYYIVFFFIEIITGRKSHARVRKIFGVVWAGAGFLYGAVFLVLINFIFAWL